MYKVVLDTEGHWRIKDLSNHGKYLRALFLYKRRAINVKNGLLANKQWAVKASDFWQWADADDGK
jgi:hypothetical protein